MDKSAIEKIQESALLPDLIKRIDNTNTPVIALPDNFRLHDLEQYLEAPTAFRGLFKTRFIEEFVSYIGAQEGTKATCFISDSDMTASIKFDLGDINIPGHGHHEAALKLEKTAPFEALLEFADSHHNQKRVAEWLEDWAHLLSAYAPNGDVLDIKKVINAVRNINIEAMRKAASEVQQLSESRSSLESIEVSSKEQLPAQIHWHGETYQDLSSRTIAMRLSIRTSETPTLCLQTIKMEECREALAREFAETIAKKVGDAAKVLIGTFGKG